MLPGRVGRPRTRTLVEEVQPVTALDLVPRRLRAGWPTTAEVDAVLAASSLSMDLGEGEAWARSLADVVVVDERAVPWSSTPVRVWLLRCPACGARRRALFVGRQGLACRVCLGYRYQSWSGRWDYPLLERFRLQLERRARAPGPKGRRYRTADRRRWRVLWLWASWFTWWTKRQAAAAGVVMRDEVPATLGGFRNSARLQAARRALLTVG